MSKVTIKDIAKYLDIHPSTVSRALRDHPDVGKELKASIIELSERLGYQPNITAINLRKGRSGIIALIIPEVANYFFPNVIKAVEEIVHAEGYQLLILNSNDIYLREKQNAEICVRLGVDGILVSLCKESSELEHFKELISRGIPMVFFDKIKQDSDTCKVSIPGEQAAYGGITYLLKNNRNIKRIAGIFGDERLSITQDRLSGFRRALFDHGIKPGPGLIHFAYHSEEAEEVFKYIWNGKNRPEGLFIMSDEILQGVIKAAYELRLSLSREIKTISMSDGFLPNICQFKIPYVKTSGFDLGKKAAQLLMQQLKEQRILKGNYFIDTPLVD